MTRFVVLALLLCSGCGIHLRDAEPKPLPFPEPLPPPVVEVRPPIVVKLRAWLKSNKADFRIWDQHVDASKESADWQAAAKNRPASLPWIVISNGTAGHSGPLPKTTDETIALLEKFR
jgi:hypothetical protein